jgi:hypothetical protein
MAERITFNRIVLPTPPALPVSPVAYEQRYHEQNNNVLRLYFNQISNAFAALLGGDTTGGKYIQFPYGAFEDTTVQTAPANTAQVMRLNTTDYANGTSIGSQTAVFVGRIDDGTPPGAGTVLTVTAMTSGAIYLGMTLTGGAITAGTKVVSQTSGTAGGVGAYVVSASQERTSLTITGTVASKMVVAQAGIYNLQWSGQFVNTAAAIHEVSIWLRKGATGAATDITGSTGRVSINAKHGAFDGGGIIGWNYFVQLQANEYIELWWSTPDLDTYITSYAAGTAPVRPTTASVIATLTFVSALTA